MSVHLIIVYKNRLKKKTAAEEVARRGQLKHWWISYQYVCTFGKPCRRPPVGTVIPCCEMCQRRDGKGQGRCLWFWCSWCRPLTPQQINLPDLIGFSFNFENIPFENTPDQLIHVDIFRQMYVQNPQHLMMDWISTIICECGRERRWV